MKEELVEDEELEEKEDLGEFESGDNNDGEFDEETPEIEASQA